MNTSNSPLLDDPEMARTERRIHDLLSHYEDTTRFNSVAARVHERLASPGTADAPAAVRSWVTTPARWRTPQAGDSRGGWARGAISLGLVAALILGFVAVVALREGRSRGVASGPCTEIAGAGKNGLPNICPAGDVHPTFAVTQSYADPTRIAIALRVTTPGAVIPHGRPIVYSPVDSVSITDATLQDAHGQVYGPSEIGIGSFGFAPGTDSGILNLTFTPLPESELNGEQALTLRFGHMQLWAQGFLTYLQGSWTVSFQVTPHAGYSIALAVAPQTHQGVTVRPVRLDIGTYTGAFDTIGTGARLTLHISGLPPSTQLRTVASASFEYHFLSGSGADGLGSVRWLFEGRLPADIQTDHNTIPGDTSTVGPSGAMDVVLIFVGPPLAQVTGTQQLSLNQITLAVNPDTGLPTRTASGPWIFQIPLS